MNLDSTFALAFREYAKPGRWPRLACIAFIAGASGLMWWAIAKVVL